MHDIHKQYAFAKFRQIDGFGADAVTLGAQGKAQHSWSGREKGNMYIVGTNNIRKNACIEL